MDNNTYGNHYGPFSASVVSWWSWDESVALVNFGQVTGVSEGTTATTATVEYPLYLWEGGTFDCTPFGTQQRNANGRVDVLGTIALGSVSFTSPTPPVIRFNETATLSVVITASSIPRLLPSGWKYLRPTLAAR